MRTVNGMSWVQRCAADAEARDSHRAYGRGEFYWSAKWGALTAVADGTTTLADVADALAAGTATPYQEALAASYWVDAADYLAARAEFDLADARRGHPHEGLADDLGQVPWLIDDDELAAAEQRRTDANAVLVEAQQIQHAAGERAQDQRRWEHAETEEAYQAGGRAALEAGVAGPWRTAVDVEYDQICADYGNDGHPDNDRFVSAEDKAAQAAAVTSIAERTGLPTGAVWNVVRDVADRYSRDHTGTATLGQPDWDQVAEDWAALMEPNRADAASSEVPAWEREADQHSYWGELGESHPAVRDAFWAARDDRGVTAEDDITRVELDAAYTAAGEAIAAAAGLPAPDLAAVIAAGALAAEEAAIDASIAAAYGDEGALQDEDADAAFAAYERGLAAAHLDPIAVAFLDHVHQAQAIRDEHGVMAGYLVRVAPEASDTVGSASGLVHLTDGTELDPDEPLPVTVTPSGQALLDAEAARIRADEAADALRQADEHDADQRTHQSAVALDEAQAAAGVATQEADAAIAALAGSASPHDAGWAQDAAAAQSPTAGASTPDHPDQDGLRLDAQMLLEQAHREVTAGIEVGQVTDADALLAEMVDAIAGAPQASDPVATADPSPSAGGEASVGQDPAPLSADPVLADQVAELIGDLDATGPDPYPGDDEYQARLRRHENEQDATAPGEDSDASRQGVDAFLGNELAFWSARTLDPDPLTAEHARSVANFLAEDRRVRPSLYDDQFERAAEAGDEPPGKPSAADAVDAQRTGEWLAPDGQAQQEYAAAAEPSTGELVAAARHAVAELPERRDVAGAPVTGAPVIEDSAVTDRVPETG